MYEDCEIEGQKISQTKRRKSRRAKIDCKGSYFKPLRGLEETTRRELFHKVIGKEISFKEVAKISQYAKEMREVKTAFMSYHQLYPPGIRQWRNFQTTRRKRDWNHLWTSCSRRTTFHQLFFHFASIPNNAK